jgi:squalene-hopene/tetraprenyl-beta-curcumene cyclase
MDHDADPGRPAGRIEAVGPAAGLLDRATGAIARATHHLLGLQDPEGFWVMELEADSTLTSELLLFQHFLGLVQPAKQRKAVQYLREQQSPDGGWPIYHGGPSEVSASVKAYFALKLAGVPAGDPALRRARARILDLGGVARVNVFTRIQLALFGQFDWRGVPAMPAEIVLFPRWFYFNLYEISYWSRTVLAPLLIIMATKPLRPLPPALGLDELWLEPRERTDVRFPWDPRWLSWRNFFLAIDRLLNGYERWPIRPLRRRALAAAHGWMLRRMDGPGGLGAILPAMMNSVIALRCLGYPAGHPLVQKALAEIAALEVEDAATLHMQPCCSPVWDTALSMQVLRSAGLPADHPALRRGAAWLLRKQTLAVGDWQAKAPRARPGAWYFQFENAWYPDVDDTAAACLALLKARPADGPGRDAAIRRATGWLLGMQGRDGGWGAFDRDNDRLILNNIPFADHGALLDPSTADVTARAVEVLGHLGYDETFPPLARALAFLRRTQDPDGPWYGRWGVNYIYGTWSVLSAWRAAGGDLGDPLVRRAVGWLEGQQNPDGGWGESCHSYADPKAKGLGDSAPSQTAWALLALLQAGALDRPAVARGVEYLARTQRADGAWDEPQFTGTGFPRVFYLRYHMYAIYFPLWALAMFRTRLAGQPEPPALPPAAPCQSPELTDDR